MPLFLVRKNCEYSVVVGADDAGLAMASTENLPDDMWGQSWSELEAEPYEPPPDSSFPQESETALDAISAYGDREADSSRR